jgi:hypothetical protein
MLKLNDEAYQVIIRWAVEQGAMDDDEMALLLSESIIRAVLPGQRNRTKDAANHHPADKSRGKDTQQENKQSSPSLEAVK